jgi:hypothetical protein
MASNQSLLRRAFWKALFLLSSDLYEKRKSRRYGFGYPDFFNATRSVFIHIPKAAGTSVGLALYGRQVGHMDWNVWYEINPKKFEQYFKFSIIRNPISRFNSAFHFLKQGGMNVADKEFSDTVLKDFESPGALGKALIDPHLQEKVLDWWHFRPQAYFIADEQGRSKMDLLIRFENMEAGFRQVAQRLHCESVVLPHLNKTKDRPEEILEKEAVEVLACLYRKDFILWEKHAS